MKLVNDNQDFEGNVPAKRMAFGFSANNGKLFGILSDGIYRDKISAVIRELGCNAYDAHIVAGNPKPFRVQVPTSLNPTFSVEDEGTGIDPEKIGEIFWTYGDSTKTHSNDTIGALGLGSKSPFAYTKSSFTVKNRYAGNEHTYFCFIGEDGCPAGSEVSVEPTDKPNGVTVELAVRYEDVHAFRTRMARFYKHWPQKPEFVGSDLDIPETVASFSGKTWYYEKVNEGFGYGDARPYAIMGNVPYPIDLSSIPKPSEELKFVASNTFRLRFPIGTLSFQVSREELSYEATTVQALEAAAKAVVAELREAMKADVEALGSTNYDLWRAYKAKISEHGLANMGHIGELFDPSTVFKSKTGSSFTADQLHEVAVELSYPDLNPFPIFEIVRYTSSASLRNRSKVVMKKTITKVDDKGVSTSKDVSVTTNWYANTITPRQTKPGNHPSDYLFEDYAPIATEFSVPTTPGKLVFLINDIGYLGKEAARGLGRRDVFYFIDVPKDKTVKQAEEMIASLLKGSLVEGMEISLLSQHPRFVMPSSVPSKSYAPKPRGMVEVRVISPYSKKSEYVSVDPNGYKAYYIHTGKAEKEYFTDVLPKVIRHLKGVGLADLEDATFITRNEDDIAYMKKKGAILTHVKDVIDASMRAKLQTMYDRYSLAQASAYDEHSSQALFNWLFNNKSLFTAEKTGEAVDSPLVGMLSAWSTVKADLHDSKLQAASNLASIIRLQPSSAKAKPFGRDLVKAYPLFELFDTARLNASGRQKLVDYVLMMDKINAV